MRYAARLLSLGLALFLIDAVTYAVVESNYRNNVYRPEADTTVIPYMMTAAVSVFSAAYLSVVLLATRLLLRLPKILAAALNGLAHLPALLLALGGAAYWWLPSHHAISGAYLAWLAVLLYWLAWDTRRMLAA